MNSAVAELSQDRREAAIEIRDLRVRRGGKPILPGVSLRVPPGRVTGLLGPSGSGKTTLMRAIVGVQIVEGGQVTVLGQPAGTPALRRRVAYVTQAPVGLRRPERRGEPALFRPHPPRRRGSGSRR